MRVADARRLLGLDERADADAVRAARRRLAKGAHPDAGGDVETMRRINEAARVVLATLADPRQPAAAPMRPTAPTRPTPPTRPASGQPVDRRGRDHDLRDHDEASFTIEAYPAQAFEALFVAASSFGEMIAEEPPYQLDVLIDAAVHDARPLHCWCRLDLLPEAGASTVGLTIAALPGEPLPAIDAVRDLWVVTLNQLGRPR